MKYFSLLCLVLFLSACSKEKLYGPLKLKNGQEVELLVDHRYAAENESLLILPQNEPAGISLHGFTDRKPGYIYRVKARLNVDPNPPQDASDRWFNLTKIISKEKYQGNEQFDITLIKSIIPSGPVITMGKIDGKYYYINDKLELTYSNDAVKAQLEEIWQNGLKIQDDRKNNIQSYPKWKSIKATVTHDPNNFGKAYLVQRIEFSI
ncbi:hypothetical protein [Pedobacter nutrimenti]|uniref:hypothetical protein n=1 Tax=Pedobacter nutrimenti TaxID=1241337 RepID=UPI002931B822|nr:hypothetical protein [Pedobacter nutrimenti]